MFFLVGQAEQKSFDCAVGVHSRNHGEQRGEGESLRRAFGTWGQKHRQYADDQRRDEAGTDEVHLAVSVMGEDIPCGVT